MIRRVRTRITLIVAVLAATAVMVPDVPAATPTRDTFASVGASARLGQIVNLVESFDVPEQIGRQRWTTLLATHREAIESSGSHADFSRAVNRLLNETRVSHFAYYADDSWGYWHVRSTFDRDDPEAEIVHVGVFPERIDGSWFIRGILEGSPAAAADLLVGDELLTIDGRPYEPVTGFAGAEGATVTLRIQRRPGLILNVPVTPRRESLYEAMQRAMRQSIRVIEHDGLRLVYLHGWTLLGSGREYGDLLERQHEVGGLILDYRDGFGGTWNTALRFLLGRRTHRGAPRRDPAWHKPLVILTADGTRSAKEIVVHAVQRAERAPLIGEPTPGHVTAVGAVRRIGADGMIMLPGHRFALEGNPTQPDYLMPRDIRYTAGRDDQLEFATALLAEQVRAAGQASPSAAGR